MAGDRFLSWDEAKFSGLIPLLLFSVEIWVPLLLGDLELYYFIDTYPYVLKAIDRVLLLFFAS